MKRLLTIEAIAKISPEEKNNNSPEFQLGVKK
jgi:hypothetical protein